jgi:phospholipid transport system substrate-binding protein
MHLRLALPASALAATLALSLLLANPAPAQITQAQPAATPSFFISDLVGRAVVVLKEGDPSPPARQARFRALIGDKFDLPAIAQTVMGRHWRNATDDERQQFAAVFADYMAVTYASKIADYGHEAFTVTGERAEGPQAFLVSSNAAQGEGAKPIAIDWRAIRQEDGYRITDVIISGISLMQTKRAEIAAVIDISGGRISGMIAELRGKSGGQ